MRNVTILLAVAAVLAMSVPAYGGYVFTHWKNNNSNNDFHEDANWDATTGGDPPHLAPPETYDGDNWTGYVNMAGADYAKITKGFYTWKFWVSTGKAVMDTGDYTNPVHPGSFWVGYNSYESGPGEWIQKAGTMNGSPSIGGQNGNNDYGMGYGEYTIEGGTLNGSVTLASAMGYYGLFKVVGTDPDINLSGYKQYPIGVKGTTPSKGGNLEVILKGGGNGVSVIDCTGGTGVATLSGTLHVDVTDYTGTETVINILTATSLTYKNHTETYDPDGDTGPLGNDALWPDLVLDADSIAAGYTLGDNGSGTLQVTIPEPATLCLLGLGGIGVLIRRRR